jgi:hypothetical protein
MTTSFFSWLDYSEHDRRRALDVIGMFSERDTRDELGIGSVRDAFADLFFPGTSTIQTRARYFLFLPWIYLRLEQKKVRSSDIAWKARQEELALIKPIMESDDSEGAFGKEAGKSLKRLPSSVYWQGLGTWGIRLFPGSQAQYHQSLDGYHSSRRRLMRDDDGEPVEGTVRQNWHPGLPPPPAGFPWSNISLTLAPAEAEYLRERILTCVPGTLLAFLVDRGKPGEYVAFPWQHPQFADFPDPIREQLGHARNVSEVMHGSALLYNLMLAELVEREDLRDRYRDLLTGWQAKLDARHQALAAWNRKEFWEHVRSQGTRVSLSTESFVNSWLGLAIAEGSSVADREDARRLIRNRERAVKRGQARLENRRALELWSGAAGTAQQNYRWPNAQTIVLDILKAAVRGPTIA